MNKCRSIGCTNPSIDDFCADCAGAVGDAVQSDNASDTGEHLPLSQRYPGLYRPVGDHLEIDAFAVHQLFGIKDPTGCIQHASRKLLSSGNAERVDYQDILEARDTLTRWLQLNQGV